MPCAAHAASTDVSCSCSASSWTHVAPATLTVPGRDGVCGWGRWQYTDHRGENPHITQQPPNFVSKKTDLGGTGFPHNSPILWKGQDWKPDHSHLFQSTHFSSKLTGRTGPPSSSDHHADASHGLHFGTQGRYETTSRNARTNRPQVPPCHTHLSPDLRLGRARCNGGGWKRERRTTQENTKPHRGTGQPAPPNGSLQAAAAGLDVSWPGNHPGGRQSHRGQGLTCSANCRLLPAPHSREEPGGGVS